MKHIIYRCAGVVLICMAFFLYGCHSQSLTFCNEGLKTTVLEFAAAQSLNIYRADAKYSAQGFAGVEGSTVTVHPDQIDFENATGKRSLTCQPETLLSWEQDKTEVLMTVYCHSGQSGLGCDVDLSEGEIAEIEGISPCTISDGKILLDVPYELDDGKKYRLQGRFLYKTQEVTVHYHSYTCKNTTLMGGDNFDWKCSNGQNYVSDGPPEWPPFGCKIKGKPSVTVNGLSVQVNQGK
ncbi:MAG: hypothetical protein HQM16_19480 [Deltaproteobacteria bacterium]|nr:hypothetical protein [Deltaproteobacteria bacterium]